MSQLGSGSDQFDPAWERFSQDRAAQLQAWIDAERGLADSRVTGMDALGAGDRLMAAEAALQTAIVDFAAGQPGITNPTPLAIEILRRAEAMLAADRLRER